MSDFLKNLAAQRAERVQDLHLDLPVPTWDGSLIARFNVGDRKYVVNYAERKRTVESDIDFLIKHVRELYVLDPEKVTEGSRMEENDRYARLESDSIPVGFDSVLMEQMGVTNETGTARDVVLYLVKNNSITLMGLAGRLLTWMQNTDAKVADDLVGEA